MKLTDLDLTTDRPSSTAPARVGIATVIRLHPQASYREVGGEVFVVTADRSFHRLAVPTAVDLFRLVARGAVSRDSLVDHLTCHYDVTAARAAADVDAFVETLVARQIAVAATGAEP